ncbi:MAG: hypothetical protein WA958_14010 [Tunicatimonas sp.]
MTHFIPQAVRCLLIGLIALSAHAAQAQDNLSTKPGADSLRAEILRLRTDLDATRDNLRISHKKFRTGILVSGIGYSITILGGVLLGSQQYSDWGQPLVVAGGVIGFSGALLLLNSNKFIGRAGTATARSSTPTANTIAPSPAGTGRRAP